MALHFADELFHLVGSAHPNDDDDNFKTLLRVLGDGVISYSPHTKDWGETRVTVNLSKSLLRNEMVVPNMVCFCDIRPEHLGEHVRKYGRFGVSVTKSHAIRYGTRPVMYVPYRSDNRGSPYGTELLRDVEAALKSYGRYMRARVPETSTTSRSLGKVVGSPRQTVEILGGILTKDMLGFVKAFDSELSDTDDAYFYSEREWRRLGNLKFEQRDVKHVVVARGFEKALPAEFHSYRKHLLTISF